MPSFTRPCSSVIDYNAVTGDSVTTAAQKHDIAVDDLYTNIVDATTSAKGIVQLGTTSAKAAAGDHLHTGTYQPSDATLTALAGVTTSADTVIYATGADTFTTASLTAAGRAILDDTDASAQRTTLGVDTLSRRNRLCNGDFRVDNISAGAAVTPAATAWVADNFRLVTNVASKLTAQRIAATLSMFGYSEKILTASAVASPGAEDYFSCDMAVEGLDMADLMWGTANAQPITVSFTVKASISGSYSFAVRNSAGDRTYCFTETLVANTEKNVAKTIPGDTTGTWPVTAVTGLRLNFDLGAGSNFEAAADAWTAGAYRRVAGTVRIVSTLAATYEISGIQIEKGSFATPFEVLPYQQAESWCQRYHPVFVAVSNTDALPGTGAVSSSTTAYIPLALPAKARASVTGAVASAANIITTSGSATSAITFNTGGVNAAILVLTGTGWTVGPAFVTRFNTAGASIRFTGAEL